MKKAYYYILGLVSGIINGIFGSGGGMIVVPLLEKSDIETKKAHATSIAIILPLSIASAIMYLSYGHLELAQGLKFIPGGFIGTIIGCLFLKKVPTKILKCAFGILIIIAGVRILFK